ncbi:hypothetical protein [Mesorhizobium sophorae]|uniref:hypothetical protein n=1 Tax=Mesorhizobium sophorae TaxID=1300294 RepID=UPI000BA32597|nr:hypothetical protein [Mesorhizobium sophorae]
MADDSEPITVDDSEQPTTLPTNVGISLSGSFESEDKAREFAYRVLGSMRVLGRSMDLSGVDGVTISGDYHEALAALDRGIEGLRPLTASTDEDGVIGIAMAPAVLRDGKLKTHLVFHVHALLGLAEPEAELFPLAVHTLAHECAHAMLHTAFDKRFPNVILRESRSNYFDRFRLEVTDACWEEYGATRASADWGADPTDGYVSTFVKALSETGQSANEFILSYRTHGDIDQILAEVPPLYGNLIKWASYLIGTMHGLDKKIADLPELAEALNGHWFSEYFEKLETAYRKLWERLGEWDERAEFDPIGDIAIDVLERGGIKLIKTSPDDTKVEIPFRTWNTPMGGLLNLMGRF